MFNFNYNSEKIRRRNKFKWKWLKHMKWMNELNDVNKKEGFDGNLVKINQGIGSVNINRSNGFW